MTDLLQDLGAPAALPAPPDGWYTRADLVRALKMSDKKVLALLRERMEAGRLEVGRVQRTTLSGVTQPTPAYRLANE